MPITKSINRVTTITDYIQRIIKIQDLNEQADNHAELIFRGQSTDEPLLPREELRAELGSDLDYRIYLTRL